MAQRMGVSGSTLHMLENSGKGSLNSRSRRVRCLWQERQLPPLFMPVVTSITEMECQH